MKKTWTNATIEELSIEQTLYGGKVKNDHDGEWQTNPDGTQWEAVWPIDSEGK